MRTFVPVAFALVLGVGCRLGFDEIGSTGDGGGSGEADAVRTGCDAATCSTGTGCTADNECISGQCECADASCASRVCSAVDCVCQFNSDGGSSCSGDLAAGVDDANGTCSGGCDGSGGCVLPFLWYRLDELPGATSFANSGTWSGTYSSFTGTLGVAGIRGNAIRFGVNDVITIADPIDGSLDGFASFTIEAWINLTTLPRNGIAPVLMKGVYGCAFGEQQACTDCYTGNVFVTFAGGSGAAAWPIAIAPTVNTWVHLACSYGPSYMTAYWNGSRLNTVTFAGGPTTDSASSITIGKTASDPLDGLLDDLKLWKSQLSDRQVCADACGSFAGGTCTFDGICGN